MTMFMIILSFNKALDFVLFNCSQQVNIHFSAATCLQSDTNKQNNMYVVVARTKNTGSLDLNNCN